MKNLIERIEICCSSIDRLQSMSEERKNLKGLESRSQQIENACYDLTVAKASERLLLSKGIKFDQEKPSKALRLKIIEFQQKFESNWKNLVSDSMIVNTFVNPIRNYTEKVNTSSIQAWRSYVDSNEIDFSDDFIDAMSVAGFESKCDEIRRNKAEVQNCRIRCPKTSEEVERVEHLKSEMQSVWRELEGVPNDVVKFLQKAARLEARLDDIKPDIHDWLIEHSMIDKLRVGLA